jgi:uncharacterized membrane protein YcaP (DUF421 family)
MKNIFFDSWESIARTIIITIMAYAFLIFFLRTSGKRTLSKMNAFDFIVTIALGSTLATVMLNKNVALLDGVLAFFLLVYLQYIITSISARSKKFSNIIKSSPTLLVHKGQLLQQVMKKERVTEEEVYSIIREKGFSTLEQVDAVVLETDGSMTVLSEIKNVQSPVTQSINNASALTKS